MSTDCLLLMRMRGQLNHFRVETALLATSTTIHNEEFVRGDSTLLVYSASTRERGFGAFVQFSTGSLCLGSVRATSRFRSFVRTKVF
jgi:hypothetical protein